MRDGERFIKHRKKDMMITFMDENRIIEVDGRTYKLVGKIKKKLIKDGGYKDPSKGYSYWDTHDYKRKSVDNDFHGYGGMTSILSTLLPLPNLIQNLYSIIYLTGSRASEALMLTPEHFSEREGYLLVTNQLVLKHRKSYPRSYPIRKDELLMPYLQDAINQTSAGQRLIPYSYSWVYKQITSINDNLFPHYLRAYRATQLILEYNYGVYELMDYFGWSKSDTPSNYIKLTAKDLIAKMMSGKL